MVGRVDSPQVVEALVARFVGEHEESQVLAVLDSHGEDGFEQGRQFAEVDVFEEEGHDEGVNEPDLGAVLYSIPEPFEHSLNFSAEHRHSK